MHRFWSFTNDLDEVRGENFKEVFEEHALSVIILKTSGSFYLQKYFTRNIIRT